MTAAKQYTIVKTTLINSHERHYTGTVKELTEMFNYVLECGRDYQGKKIAKKINSIDSLVMNLNRAVSNLAANGNPSKFYSRLHEE